MSCMHASAFKIDHVHTCMWYVVGVTAQKVEFVTYQTRATEHQIKQFFGSWYVDAISDAYNPTLKIKFIVQSVVVG